MDALINASYVDVSQWWIHNTVRHLSNAKCSNIAERTSGQLFTRFSLRYLLLLLSFPPLSRCTASKSITEINFTIFTQCSCTLSHTHMDRQHEIYKFMKIIAHEYCIVWASRPRPHTSILLSCYLCWSFSVCASRTDSAGPWHGGNALVVAIMWNGVSNEKFPCDKSNIDSITDRHRTVQI